MNPVYVLPSFLGVLLAIALVWSVRLTGQNDRLKNKVEDLLDDVTKLAVEIPKRDDKGRFRKKC